MSGMNVVRAYCPVCGGAVMAPVVVDGVTHQFARPAIPPNLAILEVSFEIAEVSHGCETTQIGTGVEATEEKGEE